jgi:3-oxoacyl-[acyl-carrier protein] reductase
MTSAVTKRTIIVTGSSRGLGKEIALVFGTSGYRVVVNYVSGEQQAAEVAAQIVRFGGEAFAFRADVKVFSAVDAMIAETMKRWGGIDVLINNAGVTKDSLLLRMTEQDWDLVIDTNLKGPFNAIRAVSGVMAKQRNGHIINIASIVGLQGREGQANYSSAKAGLIGLTKSSAKELGRFNIKVNAVLPGYIPTDMGSTVSDSIRDRVRSENALGRVSDPREIALFIQHLCLMNNVSGQVFNLDSRII